MHAKDYILGNRFLYLKKGTQSKNIRIRASTYKIKRKKRVDTASGLKFAFPSSSPLIHQD